MQYMVKLSEVMKINSLNGDEIMLLISKDGQIIQYGNIQGFMNLIKKSISINVRNLFINTKTYVGWTKNSNTTLLSETYCGLTIEKHNYSWAGHSQKYEFKAGVTYTMGAYIRSQSGTLLYASVPWASTHMGNAPNSFKRISLTFTIPEDRIDSPRFVIPPSTGIEYDLEVCGYTLTEGNMDIGWIPAPEDMINV